MAIISPFRRPINETKEPAPVELALFRKLAASEDIRLLLGSYFLKLAESEPKSVRHPHLDLLTRMAAGRTLGCDAQLRILAKNLYLLRDYDNQKASAS